MERYVFKMRLNPGRSDDYRARHDAIWPELVALLRASGISAYSIHLDPDTNLLIGCLERREGHTMDDLPSHPVMQRWWAHMRDLMATAPDGAPLSTALVPMFYME